MPTSTRLVREAKSNMTELKRRRRRAAPAGIAPNEPERDILDQYLYEVSTYPLLKGTEEIELAKKIRAGDQDSLQELVKRNLRFVISVAKKYQNRGLPLIDLIGEGNRTPDLLNAIQALSQLSYAPSSQLISAKQPKAVGRNHQV